MVGWFSNQENVLQINGCEAMVQQDVAMLFVVATASVNRV